MQKGNNSHLSGCSSAAMQVFTVSSNAYPTYAHSPAPPTFPTALYTPAAAHLCTPSGMLKTPMYSNCTKCDLHRPTQPSDSSVAVIAAAINTKDRPRHAVAPGGALASLVFGIAVRSFQCFSMHGQHIAIVVTQPLNRRCYEVQSSYFNARLPPASMQVHLQSI